MALPASAGHATPQQLPLSPPAQSMDAESAAFAKRRRRLAAAAQANCCRTCRLRKVKCTGNPNNGDPCSNCARLSLDCPFVNGSAASNDSARVTPSQSHTEAGTLRKRAQRACRQCHVQKTRCSGDLPSCRRCDANELPCDYPATKRSTVARAASKQPKSEDGSVSPPGAARGFVPTTPTALPVAAAPTPPYTTTTASLPSSRSDHGSGSSQADLGHASNGSGHFLLAIEPSVLTSQELLTRKDFLLRNLEAYFHHLYWMPCLGLFNPKTAYREVHEGRFDPPTAAAICALSSIFIGKGEEGREFGLKCADEVEYYLFRNMHKFSENSLLPYALIISFNFLKGAFAKTWQLYGVAARLMTGMRLNWDSPGRGRSFQQQELLRRIAWHFFFIDRCLAGGYDEYLSCREEDMKIRLPCGEEAYWGNRAVQAPRLSGKVVKCDAMGIHGLSIRMADIYHRIKTWTKTLEFRDTLEPSKIMEGISKYQNEVTRFHTSLPDDMRLSDQSVSKYMSMPEGAAYTFIHSRLAACHIELYRFALPDILNPGKNEILARLPDEFVERCKKQAVAHALCFGHLCVAVRAEVRKHQAAGRRLPAIDCTLPQIATHALRVLIITMLHGIYDTLMEDTTAPLWRFQNPDEQHIRALIQDGLLSISSLLSPLLDTCEQAHVANAAMYEEFNRSQKFIDREGTLGFVGARDPTAKNSTDSLSATPHYILENVGRNVAEQEKRQRTREASLPDRWFHERSRDIDTPPPRTTDTDDDPEFAPPPGLPTALAAAWGTSLDQQQMTPDPAAALYFSDDIPMILQQQRMWFGESPDPAAGPAGSLTTNPAPAMTSPAPNHFPAHTHAAVTTTAAAMPMMHHHMVTAGPSDVMFSQHATHVGQPQTSGMAHHQHQQHQHQHQHPHQQFMSPPQGMFMDSNGYGTSGTGYGGGNVSIGYAGM